MSPAVESGPASSLKLRFAVVEQVGMYDARVEWVLKRNCAVSPGQVLVFYVSISTVSLAIGLFFWAQGATFVLFFTFVELFAIAVALLVHARHVGDGERVSLHAGRLVIEVRSGASVSHFDWPAPWVRVAATGESGRGLIEFSGRGRSVEVGRHVRPELRRPLASEFGRALQVLAHG